MKKLQFYLSGFLALQLLLAGGLFWSQLRGQAAQQQREALLTVAAGDLQRLEISSGENTATLAREDGQWQLPALGGLPVDSSKLNTLLEKLADLQGGWPVATSGAARQRFEVAEGKFQKRLRLYTAGADEEELAAELYIGTSPGFRKVHLRRADDDAIYAVSLNSYELPVEPDSWLDKQLLAAGKVEAIKGPDYRLAKRDGKWQFGDGEAELDTHKAGQLASALAGLRVSKAAERMPQGEGVQLSVTTDRGELQYTFRAADDRYYVSRSDLSQPFELSKYDYDRIAGPRSEQLVLEKRDDTEQTAGDKAEEGAEEESGAHS